MKIIRSSKPTARKRHQCDFCSGFIEAGEKYERSTIIYDDMYDWKCHMKCEKIAQKLDMYGEVGHDGLDGSMFQEFIRDAFEIITGSLCKEHPKFLDKLEIVLKYYEL